MLITIKEVNTPKELKNFIKFPYLLYKGNPYWVPPMLLDEKKVLNKEKNPAFEFCDVKLWLAYKNGKIAGRIAGIINRRYIEAWKNNYARFSYIDFIDDTEVSKALFDAAEKWAIENNIEKIHGPLGFTDFDPEGMLVEGFEELGTFGAIYNYPYYVKHIEKYGYKKDVDWIEFQVKPPEQLLEKVDRIADIVSKKYGLKILRVKKAKELLPYGKEIFYLINRAYKDLFGFVQLSDKQIELYIKEYFGFIKPEFVPVVLDNQNKIVAFGITMPSLSKALQKNRGRLFPFGFIPMLKAMKNNNMADLYLVAVDPDMQDKGVNALLINEINKIFIKNKITLVETNRELETNLKVQAQWKEMDARQHKRRRCYIKNLVK
jgi:GNAT superfamily N-acetyltransferase